jgi:hypothetical protein
MNKSPARAVSKVASKAAADSSGRGNQASSSRDRAVSMVVSKSRDSSSRSLDAKAATRVAHNAAATASADCKKRFVPSLPNVSDERRELQEKEFQNNSRWAEDRHQLRADGAPAGSRAGG